jgi:3-vinyl bacteriochlorophyllide hydratase
MYTAEQLARRDTSPLTRAMMIGGIAQLVVIILSYSFVIRFLAGGEGYSVVMITFWLNVALLWFNTIVGMLWEKDMYDHWFMCKEFFREDVGNLAALIAYHAYFVALWLQWGRKEIAILMLVANSVYMVNFIQWIAQLMKSMKARQNTVNR